MDDIRYIDKVEFIDKNAVKRLLDDPQDYVDPYEKTGFYEALDDVPVIEAIPVAWLESYFYSNGLDLHFIRGIIQTWRYING